MERRRCLVGIFTLLATAEFSKSAVARVVCEGGINKFGDYVPCKKWHHELGAPEGRRPVDANRVGEVEKVHKNLDGSVTVWRHGSPDTEEWTQTDKDTWERKR